MEHYAGALPLWLAPVQAAVIPIADRHNDYAYSVRSALEAAGGRVQVYDKNEPMRAKIAQAQSQQVPYMLVVGDKEAQNSSVSVRERRAGDLGSQPLAEFAQLLANARV